ncbi:MAG: diacylglycerol kinase family lipid kinase [Eubacteriales bacterium]|nr:diacylglycerol kinase family lipid kinase [Eubacteriales bacterium]
MYCFIVNPKSCSGKGLKIWGSVAKELQENQVEYKVFFTEHRGHACELAKKASTEYLPCTIVAVGGDGTANEVINGLCNYDSIQFGYIPTGSGNDLARGLSLPAKPDAALSCILHPNRIQYLSVGTNLLDGVPKRFIVSTGMGFDAAVCHEAMQSKIKSALNRFGLGKLTYLGIALKQLLLLRPGSVTLKMDGEKQQRFEHVFFAAVMNLKYEGGGFMFCPRANAQDDYLDICLVEQMPKLKILFLLPTAFKGRHTKFKGIHIFRCKKAVLQADDVLTVHTDGESHGSHLCMEISLSTQKLPFITG